MTALEGMWALVRLALRRDRTRLTVWTLVLSYLPVGVAAAFAGLYDTEAARRELVSTVATNPGLVALLGPVHGATIGDLVVWRVGTIGALLIGIFAASTVIRHTRAEEETGRRELIGSTVVGRHAPLAAAVAVATGSCAVIGLVVTFGLVGVGEPALGSIAFGLGWMGAGMVFAGVGAIAAQLTEGAGAAQGIAIGAVGSAFLARLAGDGGESAGLGWLSWTSPLGWFSKIRPYAGERWWVVGMALGLAALLALAGFALSSRRDVGAGVFPPRPGPASAPPGLATPLALAWRLQRGALLGWSVGLAAIGAVYGTLGDTVVEMMQENPILGDILDRLGGAGALTDVFFSAAMGILGLIASGFAIRSVLRLDTEESALRAEPVLATPVPRPRWMMSHLVLALGGAVVLMAAAGVAAGLTHGAAIGQPVGSLARLVEPAMYQVPAIWVLVGVAGVLYGFVPRLVGVSWGVLGACLLVGQLGQILRFPQWVVNLSPFTHVPLLPGEPPVTPMMWLVAIAAVSIAAGVLGFRRRDVL